MTARAGKPSCCPPRGVPDANSGAPRPVRRDVAPPARAVRVEGGTVSIGTDAPVIPDDGEGARRARLKPFFIDPYAVTNSWFAAFVDDTGYATTAERLGWSYVFFQFLNDADAMKKIAGAEWWRAVPGAAWRHPEGPDTSTGGREDHPAVHISYDDAAAFAAWAGGRLPSEAEWEHAARGGLARPRFPWGEEEPADGGPFPCNIWQGQFPSRNTKADGFAATAPVTAFAPNAHGLYNMCGNTWEWCRDAFRVRSLKKSAGALNAQMQTGGYRVLKGGSYLCHSSYCYRYRIAARTGSPADSTTGHVGFRIVWP